MEAIFHQHDQEKGYSKASPSIPDSICLKKGTEKRLSARPGPSLEEEVPVKRKKKRQQESPRQISEGKRNIKGKSGE